MDLGRREGWKKYMYEKVFTERNVSLVCYVHTPPHPRLHMALLVSVFSLLQEFLQEVLCNLRISYRSVPVTRFECLGPLELGVVVLE